MSAQQIKRFVAEIYNTDTQVKRVLKEIDSLNSLDKASFKVQLTQFGLGFKIMVTIESQLIDQYPILASLKQYGPIQFDVLLDNKFPFTHPKVVCKTPISTPSFADGRNLTPEIIQDQWAPSILMSKIILMIPQFLAVIASKQKDKLFLIHLGGFQVGDEYDLEQFLNLNNVHIFSCQEHLQKGKLAKKFLVITGSQFLSFEILNEKDNIVLLEKQYYIYELQKIQVRSEKENINVLQIDFVVQGDEGNEESQLTVEMKQSREFIEKIKENIQRLDLKQVLPKKIQISEDDVTIKAYQSTDIELIENSIASLTAQIEDDGLKLTDINQLTELYQKAIEFYSAIADDKFMTYMQSLKELLQRDDVQKILQDKQESIKAEKANQLRISNANEQQQQQQQLGEEKKEENEQKTTENMDNQHDRETKSDIQNTSNKSEGQDSIFIDQTNQHKQDQQEQIQSKIDNNQDNSQVNSDNTEKTQEKQKEIIDQDEAEEKNIAQELLDNKKQSEEQQEQGVNQSEEDRKNEESQINEKEQGQKVETQEKSEEVNVGDDQEKQQCKDENVQVENELKNDDNKEVEQDQQEDQEQIKTNEEENNQKEEGNEENNQNNEETGDNIKKPASKKGQQKKPPGRANKGSSKKA